MRLGMTESEVRRMLEKAANQWIKEESSGDKRGGAGEVEDTNKLICFMFHVCLQEMTFDLYTCCYLEAVAGREGLPRRGVQRQPGDDQTFLP